jgi:hypothetical protein
MILEALKHPGCVGTTRAALLKHLGQRHKRTFADIWELVAYLKEHHPDFDIDGAARREVARLWHNAREQVPPVQR